MFSTVKQINPYSVLEIFNFESFTPLLVFYTRSYSFFTEQCYIKPLHSLPIGPDDSQATQSLWESGEDWRLGHTIQTLKFSE